MKKMDKAISRSITIIFDYFASCLNEFENNIMVTFVLELTETNKAILAMI